jgi:hypothetical protein
MSNHFRPGPELAAAQAGRADALRFIERFARHWCAPLAPGDGCGADELAGAESRLGLRLPAAVRELYGLIGHRADPTACQDRLLPPELLTVDDGAVVFRLENQGCAEWAIALDDLALDDPPVVFRRTDEDGPWLPFLDRFSLAGVEMVLSEALFADGGRLSDNRGLGGADPADSLPALERLPFPEYPMWAGDGVTRWFTLPGALLRDDAGEWLWARSLTESGLGEIRELLPGDWILAPHG